MKLKNKVFILITIITVIGSSLYLYYREGTLPINKNDKTTKIFIIQKGENLTSVAKNLYKAELIRNKLIFYLVIKQLGFEKKIQAGDFRLSPSMNASQIAETLTHGTLDVWVTIIEGLRKEEIAQIFSKELNIPENEFIKNAHEGYLFPDTYLIPRQATAEGVINLLTNNFNKKYNQKLKRKARLKGLTDLQVITLASLVEKEAKFNQDRKKVASIILKRIRNDWPLQIDATVQYTLGYQPNEKTWWKQKLTVDDLKIDSLYNTYKYKGLPPGPIANPGLSSIKAVVKANENTPYWYYLSDKSGQMHYSKNLEEHNANIKKYLR